MADHHLTAPDDRIPLASGARMPSLGLGTWQLLGNTAGTVEAALALGYRMIDTASDYGTQRGIGAALRRSRLPRNAVYIVTKIEEDDIPADALRRNLDKLQLAMADLVLIHRPQPTGAGRSLWEGLLEAKQAGLTRDIGVSNYAIAQLETLIEASGEAPAVNQIEWSPFGHSREMMRWCRRRHIVLQAYSPLTRGLRLQDPTLQSIADQHGRTPAQIMLRWSLQSGAVPLPKANQRHHLRDNLGAFDFTLSDEAMACLNALNHHYSALGPSLHYL